jgi:hypothetical protein
VDCGAAEGEREVVRKGIDGYGRERMKLLMLKEAEIRAKGCSLQYTINLAAGVVGRRGGTFLCRDWRRKGPGRLRLVE